MVIFVQIEGWVVEYIFSVILCLYLYVWYNALNKTEISIENLGSHQIVW